MTTSEKRVIAVTAFFAIVGIGLIVTAFASDHWVQSELRGNETDNRTESAEMKFGLFRGDGGYDVLGPRTVKLELKCDLSESICGYINVKNEDKSIQDFEKQIKLYRNGTKDLETYGLFGFPLFVTNLVMLCLSMVFGLLAVGFAIFNAVGRPIETIAGVAGLYIWNALGLIFVVIGICVYIALFYTQLSDSVPHMEMLVLEGTTWKDDTKFDWSFYCVAGSAGAYLINIFLLLISGKKCSCSYLKSGEKEVDNGMILY